MRGGKLYALVLSSIVSIAMSLPRLRNLLFVGLLLLVGGALLASYLLSWQPADREAAPLHCQGAAPALKPGQALKVMTWNIQYLAGKRYVFWDDLPDATGPDQRPTAEDLAFTLDEVVRVIRDEQPDLVLLQEIDDGSSATDDQDQLALIQERINDLYHCSAQAYEWKSAFVPTPRIFGSVGRKQATLSRYRIDSAERRQLPPRDGGLFDRLFAAPGDPGQPPADRRRRRAGRAQRPLRPPAGERRHPRAPGRDHPLLDELQARRTPWLLGGDLNLLPPGQYPTCWRRAPYREDSELAVLSGRFPMVPSLEEASGVDQVRWYTHFPNDPRVQGPDRTLDYLFHSPSLTRLDARVRRSDTLQISNHLPLAARFLLPH